MGLEHLCIGFGALLLLERRSRDLRQLVYLADPALVVLLKRVDGHLERLAIHDGLYGLSMGWRDVLRDDRARRQCSDG
jgi:hypothetical protein